MGVAIAGAVIGAVGLISSVLGSKKGAKAAKDAARDEARLEGLVTQEKLRTLDIDERRLYGQTLANYAGKGVQSMTPSLGSSAIRAGSPTSVLQEQSREFRYQKDIVGKVGASKAQASLTEGRNIADQYRWTGYANVAASVSNILSNYSAMKGP